MARPKAPPGSPDEIEQQFYEAMQQGDIDRLMALWSDDDEIVCAHPSGVRALGPAAVRASFEAIFARGGVDVRARRVNQLQSLASAVHSVIESVAVTTEHGPRQASAFATNVYLRTAQGWRLVAHHASHGLDEPPDHPADPPNTLH